MGFWVFFSDDKVEYYDSDACELYLSPDREIAIVANSKVILDYLIVNRNSALSRDQIIAKIDGYEDNNGTSNKYADRSPVDQAIRELRKKLDKYADCVKTVRGIGYKYVGPPKVDKESSTARPDSSYLHSSNTDDSTNEENAKKTIGSTRMPDFQQEHGVVQSSNDNVINLAALVIHKNSEDRPPIDDDLRYEISEIVKLLEQGLSEDFEEICEQAWAELSLMQKALKIFKAYENLTDRSPTLSPTDTNTRI